jgi:F0F1-type ATP synthase assembly protein I
MRTARASAIGLQFAISIAIGALGGRWLDTRFDTEPWLMLLGIVLGSAAAFRDMAKIAREEEER